MLKEFKSFLESLPHSSQNNSRKIVRTDVAKLLDLDHNQAAPLINDKYGTDYDYKGARPSDFGNEQQSVPSVDMSEASYDESDDALLSGINEINL